MVFDGGIQMQPEGGEFTGPRLTTNQYRAGFALVRVATNAAPWFAVPSNAVLHAPWTRYGVAEDTFWLPATNWAFILGTNAVEGLHVSSSGTLSFGWPKGSPRARELPDGSELDFLAPLQTHIGIVPPAGRFWHAPTLSNSLLLTWQDVYANRNTNYPISFQSELFASGDFTFRYDLSRFPSPVSCFPSPDFTIGAQHNGGGGTYAFSDTNHLVNGLELRWRAFGLLDPDIDDHDGDGLSTYDEVMIHDSDPRVTDSDLDGVADGAEVTAGSNPMLRDTDGDGLIDGSDPDPLNATSLADEDGDGIPDAYENWRFESTNVVNSLAADITTNGFLLAAEIAAGLDPHRAAAPLVFPADNLAGWQLCNPFAATFAGGTNLVYERAFRIDRAGGWQQYFVSASSNAPAGWSLEGMTLEWQDSEGASGTATASSGDSLRLPVSTNSPATLTLRLRRTAASARCPQPLHLLVWAPGIALSGGTQASTNDVDCTVVNLDTGGNLAATFDRANRPCLAPPSAEELAATSDPFGVLDTGLEFSATFGADGAASGGNLVIRTPGLREIPAPVPPTALLDGTGAAPDAENLRALGTTALPSGNGTSSTLLLAISPVLTWGEGLHGSGGCGDRLYYNPDTGEYGEIFEYPLDSGCLWRNWWRESDGGYECTCEPRVSFGDSELDDWFQTDFTYSAVDQVEATVTLGGTFIWRDEAWHQTGTGDGCIEKGVELLSSDECGDCSGCENGNCDGFEGSSTGSLSFRIPLGTPRQGQVSGFLWFRTDEPLTITPAVFNLRARSDAEILVESNNVGQTISRVHCGDERGRDLRIAPMGNGVRIAVSNALCMILEHTWEIANEGGSPSQIRLRKISRLNNTMSDHTYTCDGGVWTCFDNIAQVAETVTKSGDLNNPYDDTLREERIVQESGEIVLSHTIVESRRFGNGETAVLRETTRYEKAHGENNWKTTWADYWTDIGNPSRNGRPKLVWGDDRAWRYQTWDDRGRETLRLDQWDGSECPAALQGDTPLTLTNLPACIVCTATVMDYEGHAGDSNHSDEFASPRTVTMHLVRDGASTVISRTWHVYSHSTNTYATVTRLTIRANSATAAIGDSGNAVSTETSFHADATGVPLLLRGRPLSATDENGVTTTYEYALGTFDAATRAFTVSSNGPHLRTVSMQTTAAAPTGIAGKSVKNLTIQDATHGVTLHTATLAILPNWSLSEAFDWQTHTYDEKNRLRSTRYSDGASSTNAYSCCRLLWTMDRDGNKILRSAVTGSDHLNHAMEDVSLAGLPHDELYVPYANWYSTDFNAFRVTQHYFDALGRETNTIVRPAKVEGVAIDPNFVYNKGWRTSETTTYPDGTSDCSVRTDMRGVRTVSRSSAYEDRDECQTQVFHPTNLVTPVSTDLSISYRNGATVTQREWNGQWTRNTRLTEYDDSGCRIDIQVTEASDHAAVTNSVTLSDFLGRTVTTHTPLGVTSNFYDGATMRILATTRTGYPCTENLYDDLGDPVGAVVSGITNRTDVSYATVGGEVWRVTESLACAARSVIRERLTGLSDTLRRHNFKVGANNVTNEMTAVWNESARTITETQTSSLRATPSVRVQKFGRTISETSADGGRNFFFDPYGRVFYTERRPSVTSAWLSETWFGFNDFGDVAEHDAFIASGSTYAITSYAFDAFGHETVRVDALGNAVTNAYDALGWRVATSGATYPVTHGFDTAGRMKALSTTRDGGTWDTTRWFYDHTTSMLTNKAYADNSVVTYTHTPDGKPLRTTWARGEWREHTYNADGLLAATAYSDATPAVTLAYDALQCLASASNAVASYAYTSDMLGAATNEIASVGTNSHRLARQFDRFHRLLSMAIDGNPVFYGYDDENRLSIVSNDAFTVAYAYTPDGWDAGYSVTLTNGTILSRAVTRDPHRRGLVKTITNAVDGVPVNPLAYNYDLLNRVTSRNSDAFGYNARSEVSSAIIAPNHTNHYEYDNIGNNLWMSLNTATNLYTSNPLNQYTNIANGATFEPVYDLDGNMTWDGRFSYTWDMENRLVAAYSNDLCVVSNAYDHLSRRVLKVTPEATHTYLYDGWNLVQETISTASGTTTNHYVWGKDLSGTLQGAGGVGGLLAVQLGGAWYFPFYENNGNVLAYADETGTIVAEYLYDAFGRTIEATGHLADIFRYRFSTKYYDCETGLYYYGYRFYAPEFMRWINRDPIEEDGGLNLYGYVANNPIIYIDPFGNVLTWNQAILSGLKFAGGATMTWVGLVVAVGGTPVSGPAAWLAGGGLATWGVTVMADAVNEVQAIVRDLGPPEPIVVTSYVRYFEWASGSSLGEQGWRRVRVAYYSIDLTMACFSVHGAWSTVASKAVVTRPVLGGLPGTLRGTLIGYQSTISVKVLSTASETPMMIYDAHSIVQDSSEIWDNVGPEFTPEPIPPYPPR
jgi:RHS repeat-associated protein